MVDNRAPTNTENKYRAVNADQDDPSETRVKTRMPSELRSISAIDWITVAVLCFVNLINYMDRFTVAGESRISISLYDVELRCRINFRKLFFNEWNK